jgi:hypothetical protein
MSASQGRQPEDNTIAARDLHNSILRKIQGKSGSSPDYRVAAAGRISSTSTLVG